MSDLLSRSFVMSRLDIQYCVQGIVMLEGRLQRQRSRAIPGSAVWRALGDELEALMALRNRFSYGGTDAPATEVASAQVEVGSQVPASRKSNKSS